MENADRITRVVERYYNLAPGDLITRTHKHSIAHPRFLAIYVLRRILKIGVQPVSDYFGIHRASTIHAVNEFENMMCVNHLTYRKDLQDILEIFNTWVDSDMIGATPENEIESIKNLESVC